MYNINFMQLSISIKFQLRRVGSYQGKTMHCINDVYNINLLYLKFIYIFILVCMNHKRKNNEGMHTKHYGVQLIFGT